MPATTAEIALHRAGRVLLAALFLAGAVQKATDPAPVAGMIASIGLPGWLVWPVALFDLVAAVGLVFGPRIRLWAVVMAVYCMGTSYFHWRLAAADPWQMTIFVKNWAIAGGLLVLGAQPLPGRR